MKVYKNKNVDAKPNPKREELKALSRVAKLLVKQGAYDSVNEAIIKECYTNDENYEFNTFWGWIAKGYSVKKGSKAFLIWGKPLKVKNIAEVNENDEFKYFPLAYIFSNAQVESIYQVEKA